MENKQNKPRWKLNIFDIIIIAVVIIAAAILIFIWRSSDKSSSAAINTTPVHYTIELNGMMPETANKIKEGDTIIDGTKKFIMGTVISVSLGPTTTPEKNLLNGDTVTSGIPGKVTATIELLSDCSSTESEIKAASGYIVRIGTEVHATGPGYAGIGYVVVIDRGDLE